MMPRRIFRGSPIPNFGRSNTQGLQEPAVVGISKAALPAEGGGCRCVDTPRVAEPERAISATIGFRELQRCRNSSRVGIRDCKACSDSGAEHSGEGREPCKSRRSCRGESGRAKAVRYSGSYSATGCFRANGRRGRPDRNCGCAPALRSGSVHVRA